MIRTSHTALILPEHEPLYSSKPNQVSAHLIEDIRREVLAHYHVPTAAQLLVQGQLGVKYFDEGRDKRWGIFCRYMEEAQRPGRSLFCG